MIKHLVLQIRNKHLYCGGIWFFWKQPVVGRIALETNIGFAWPQKIKEGVMPKHIGFKKFYEPDK